MIFFHCILTLFLIAVMYYDITNYTIPNWISGILLVLFPVMFLMSQMPPDYSVWLSLAVMLAVFALGVFIFVMKWAGGGDVKLLTVLALWTGVESTAELLIYTALLGGVLALALVLMRPLAARIKQTTNPEDLPRILRHNEPLPYGLAITVSFLIILWMGNIPGLPVQW